MYNVKCALHTWENLSLLTRFTFEFHSLLMYIFDRWSPYSYQNNRDKYIDDDEKREFNMKECLWFCMTSLTPQVNLNENHSKLLNNFIFQVLIAIFFFLTLIRVAEKLQKVSRFLLNSEKKAIRYSLSFFRIFFRSFRTISGSNMVVVRVKLNLLLFTIFSEDLHSNFSCFYVDLSSLLHIRQTWRHS